LLEKADLRQPRAHPVLIIENRFQTAPADLETMAAQTSNEVSCFMVYVIRPVSWSDSRIPVCVSFEYCHWADP
jgi:hypothetical protein